MAFSLINENATINIPADYYGAIIGKNGANIKRIKEQYNVNVIFPNKSTNEKNIIINGIDQEACLHAKHDILHLYNNLRLKNSVKNKSSYATPSPATDLPVVKLEVYIPKDFHGSIIGKNGGNINRIKEQYNVNVIFPNRTTDQEDIIIYGIDQQTCLNAKGEILDIYNSQVSAIQERQARHEQWQERQKEKEKRKYEWEQRQKEKEKRKYELQERRKATTPHDSTPLCKGSGPRKPTVHCTTSRSYTYRVWIDGENEIFTGHTCDCLCFCGRCGYGYDIGGFRKDPTVYGCPGGSQW
ncbi:unnamed protein product [Adineta steineri]|uniref:K Homology domain-containing protein n=1 Tax=Adineta steineri TaxID=433720 RepID=A0A818R1E7_9BILA|nr:unnamed protein product [Adineta steineri]CAF3642822.1 unnamed protein product [Adineta steineri]